MGLGEGESSGRQDYETSAVVRASQLPLVRSALESVTSAYSGVKGRYPLLGLMGDVSLQALSRATPLLQSLEPQIEVANSFALVGLDRLERNFPILNQSTEEVVGHLKDAVLLTLDDVQMWMVDGLDGALDQMERLADGARSALRQLQDTQVGRAAASGLDDVLSRVEDATAYYLPLPPTLRRQWETRVQEYEDEDEEDEPSLWTRLRSLTLTLSLQLHHRLSRVQEQLGAAADKAGLTRVLDLLSDLLQFLQGLLVALVYQAESLREASLSGVRGRAAALAALRPVRQVRALPAQVQQLLGDLQELSRMLLQLLVNATPLYGLLQQPSAQEVEDFLNQEDFGADASSRRSSASSLFLKAMDGRPRRRRSLYSLAARGSGGPQSPDPPTGRRRSSTKEAPAPAPAPAPEAEAPPVLLAPPEAAAHRRPSAAELLLTPLKQLVSQSQKALEYLSPNAAQEAQEEPAQSDRC